MKIKKRQIIDRLIFALARTLDELESLAENDVTCETVLEARELLDALEDKGYASFQRTDCLSTGQKTYIENLRKLF